MKICFLDALTMGRDMDLSIFESLGTFTCYETSTREEAASRIIGMDIVINNKVVLDEEILSHNKGIQLIALTSTGTNVVDLAYARDNHIAVTNVSGYSTKNVVQHTFALALYLMEHLREYDEYVKSGAYANSNLFTHYGTPVRELSGKTWGIIGLGEIGRSVAKIAEGFSCRVIYYSTSGKNIDPDYESVSLAELLQLSDIVSIHAPLNDATRNLLRAETMKQMKSSAILINMGRGGIVNEADLAHALNDGVIAGAGLDVLEYEPMRVDNPLLTIHDPNKIIITPHIAWASVEARQRLLQEVYLNIDAFLRGEQRNRVDKS